jgi:hypothetical protein
MSLVLGSAGEWTNHGAAVTRAFGQLREVGSCDRGHTRWACACDVVASAHGQRGMGLVGLESKVDRVLILGPAILSM